MTGASQLKYGTASGLSRSKLGLLGVAGTMTRGAYHEPDLRTAVTCATGGEVPARGGAHAAPDAWLVAVVCVIPVNT
ncbi:MAG: hypothetical protein AMXMBFR56_70060 [Polyangiaceae bacterium]